LFSILTCIDQNAIFHLKFSYKQYIAQAFSHLNVVGWPITQAHEHINSIWFKWRTRLIDNETSRAK